jgi:glycosyltransferase involved in cell wall biosynthesis
MRKILLVANTDWYLYNFRLSLAKYLRQSGFEVVMVSPAGRFVPRLQQEGFRWVEWGVGRKTLAPWSEIYAIAKLAGILSREKPDLVHNFTVKPVLYGSIAARMVGISGIVSSVTGLGYVFLRQEVKQRSIRRVVKTLYRLAFSSKNSTVIFENEADRRYFIQEGLVPEERTCLIEGVGIDTGHFTLLQEPHGLPVVVLPARMLWDKGVGVLVEAARRLHQRVQVRVALVGEPDTGNPAAVEQGLLERWSQEGVVEWWGWQEDMLDVYRQSHIVTLPSLGEGVPTALLEAAACARPIVATAVPGCRDVVIDGRNGFLVPPNDPEALSEALERLILDSGLRARMGAAGREIVLEKYTSSRVNAATLEIYSRLLNGNYFPILKG